MVSQLNRPCTYTANRSSSVASLAASVGRDLSGFHWCVFLFTNVHADHDEARDEAAGLLGENYRHNFRGIVDSVAAAGTVPEVRAKIQALTDAGARHIIIMPASRTRALDIAESIACEIAPSITT